MASTNLIAFCSDTWAVTGTAVHKECGLAVCGGVRPASGTVWSLQILLLSVQIHGRSREQRFTKNADWQYVEECAQLAAPCPVFGNGDVLSFEDYEQAFVDSPSISGVMIGRGALIKPWIFTEIKERRHWDISSTERFEILKKFVNNGLEHWGSDTKVCYMLFMGEFFIHISGWELTVEINNVIIFIYQ